MANKTKTVKIDEDVFEKVKKVCSITRQTISGFVSLSAEKDADKILETKESKLKPENK